MNIKQLNEELERILNEHADRMKSGTIIDKEKENIKCTKDAVNYLFTYHAKMQKDNIELDKRLMQIDNLYPIDITLPFNNESFKSSLTLLYGNENMGFYHILKQRKNDYLKPGNFKKLNTNEIKQAMEKLDTVIDRKEIYIDFDVETSVPYTDRILFSFDDVYYCIALQNSETSLTYLHTMFKPIPKYKKKIEMLNTRYKLQNNLYKNPPLK